MIYRQWVSRLLASGVSNRSSTLAALISRRIGSFSSFQGADMSAEVPKTRHSVSVTLCKSNPSQYLIGSGAGTCEYTPRRGCPMGLTTAELNVELAFRFRRWLNAQRYAFSTQTAYHHKALKLCAYIGDESLRRVTPMDIATFIAHVQPAGASDEFVNSYIGALRSFFDFLHLGGVVDSTAPRLVRTRPRVKRIPKILTQGQVRKLIYAAATPRDRALIELYYATGCRNSELTTVRVEDIDFRQRRFKVGAKRKERMVYFGEPAAKAIRRYLGNRTDGYLFQDAIPPQRGYITHTASSWIGCWRDFRPGKGFGMKHNKYLGSRNTMCKVVAGRKFGRFLNSVDLARPKPDRPLTKATMGKIISDCARRAGLGPMGPKILRHSFATHMIDGGADLLALQQLLGHAYLSSTQVYVHVSNKAAVKTFKKAHPRAA